MTSGINPVVVFGFIQSHPLLEGFVRHACEAFVAVEFVQHCRVGIIQVLQRFGIVLVFLIEEFLQLIQPFGQFCFCDIVVVLVLIGRAEDFLGEIAGALPIGRKSLQCSSFRQPERSSSDIAGDVDEFPVHHSTEGIIVRAGFPPRKCRDIPFKVQNIQHSLVVLKPLLCFQQLFVFVNHVWFLLIHLLWSGPKTPKRSGPCW